MKKFIVAILMVVCMALASVPKMIYAVNDLSPVIENISMKQNGIDLFNMPGHFFESKTTLDIELDYDIESALQIDENDVLDIQLKAEDSNKDFLRIDYTFSQNTSLTDEATGEQIAKVDMGNRSGIKLTFHKMNASFTAKIKIPFVFSDQEIDNYFNNHKDEAETEYCYQLCVDGKEIKELVLKMKKPDAQLPETKFSKTSGSYKQEGNELGKGKLLYNLRLGTKLNRSNEFIIYDTPDVNLSFDGDLSFCNVQEYGKLTDPFYELSSDGNHWQESGSSSQESKMEIWVYDIYYLTESKNVDEPKQAVYTEETVTFDRTDSSGATIESMQPVTKPANIILTKPSGETLTEEEEKLIEENGGLYKEVGKGFQVRIKNFKGNGINPGGFLTMVYYMNIKGNSPKLNSDGLPVYLNTASYYGQEIPNCQPGDVCEPIHYEKTTLKQINDGQNTTEGNVTPGTITGDVDKYSSVEFTKVDSETKKPLAGAKFDIYSLNNNQRVIAKNKDGVELKDLVTDANGQLTKNGQTVSLKLLRGNYVFVETSAPEGYDISENETNVTVGFLKNEVKVENNPQNQVPTPTPVITIQAEDMTIYTGGTSLSDDSFPTVRYSLDIPDSADLKDITFTYLGKNFTVNADSYTSITELQEIFTYHGENENAENDQLAGYYDIGIDKADSITATDKSGQTYDVQFEPGQLLVRYVSDPEEVLNDNDTIATPVTTSIPDTVSGKPVGVVSGDTVYKTNGKEELKLYGDSDNNIVISLLADDLLVDSQVNGYLSLKERSENFLKEANISVQNRNYEFKYLDLINETDGNAWVSSSKGVDVYWPYPEGTDINTEFEVLHFKGLHREYGFGNNDTLEDAIKSSEIEKIEITNTEQGIMFHVPESGFSLFVVSWITPDDDEDKPVTPDDDEDQPATPDDSQSNDHSTSDKVIQTESVKDSKNHNVLTGDNLVAGLWVSLALISGFGIMRFKKGKVKSKN